MGKGLPKLNMVCSTYGYRPAMNHVYMTKEYTVASDGHCLVEHRTRELFGDTFVEEMPDEPLYVHRNDWVNLTKRHELIYYNDNIGCIAVRYKENTSYIKPKTEADMEGLGKFPDWQGLFTQNEIEPVNEVGLTLSILSKIKPAIGVCERVRVQFYGATKAIILTDASHVSDFRALIMPYLLNR